MKIYLRIMCMALLAFGVIFLGGCPQEEGEKNEVDSRLVGDWSNEEPDPNERTFSIKLNGDFTASLNPGGEQGAGIVKGVLVKEDDHGEYMMNKMKEQTGKEWGSQVGQFNGVYVQITISNNGAVFELTCPDTPVVETFFGGTYNKQ